MYNEMGGTRKYRMAKRREQLEETRRRITEATVELHRTVGPAATQVSEIARRAGVQRVTVYNHFPDEASLLAACSAHWRALHPTPDPGVWAGEADPAKRLRLVLSAIFAWYRETEPMTANVLRDMQALPALGGIIESGLGAYLQRVQALVVEAFRARGRRRERIEAAARAALDFHTWRALSSLGDEEAAELAARLVEGAAAG